MKRFQYETCCVNVSDGQDINDMTEAAREVKLKTLRRHCEGVNEWATARGYGRDTGLSLGNDWAVSFHKSKFQGRPCYYIRWSAIEFIWTKLEGAP